MDRLIDTDRLHASTHTLNWMFRKKSFYFQNGLMQKGYFFIKLGKSLRERTATFLLLTKSGTYVACNRRSNRHFLKLSRHVRLSLEAFRLPLVLRHPLPETKKNIN